MNAPTRYLVLGATGMLGHTVFRFLSRSPDLQVFGTVRGVGALRLLPREIAERVITGIDVENFDTVLTALGEARPHVVINCVGLVKQMGNADDPLAALPLNSLFPHRLQRACAVGGARLVHISTDCVFSGAKGKYVEADFPDARDLYGRSKLLGEVDAPNAITLRTSIVGPEIAGSHGLLAWFLSQRGSVKGYRKAIFSGLPTVELARVIRDHVAPRPALRGVYHVVSEPITKLDLITLFAKEYGSPVEIVPDNAVAIDRSLDGTRFRQAAGYVAAPWPELVRHMREFG